MSGSLGWGGWEEVARERAAGACLEGQEGRGLVQHHVPRLVIAEEFRSGVDGTNGGDGFHSPVGLCSEGQVCPGCAHAEDADAVCVDFGTGS